VTFVRPLLLAAAAAAAALSCSHFQSTSDRTLCSESREMVCLTTLDCTMDDARGCRVCQCSSAMAPSSRSDDYGRTGAPRDRNQSP
jgi:hypothetical protein